MINIRKVDASENQVIEDVVSLHIETFKGFFLSTMNRGFLKALYKSFGEHESSELLVAFDDEKVVGFIAYSRDTSEIYNYMLKKHFFTFGWYSFLAFLRRPSVCKKLFSAFGMSSKTRRSTQYVKIFSIGVDPAFQEAGVGTMLIEELKRRMDFKRYDYITLETDAVNNDAANAFYLKNGFSLSETFTTKEGRVMNKYHYRVR